LVEIALLPDTEVYPGDWETERATGEVMEGGWTRYYDFIFGCTVICSDWLTCSLSSGDIFDSTFKLFVWNWRNESWLSQANHIFSRLGITSHFEDYGEPDHSWPISY
jgi:hypothetical protein